MYVSNETNDLSNNQFPGRFPGAPIIDPSQGGLSILSLFDGMACGALALSRLGIPVSSYTAYEIDPHAIRVADHNIPNITRPEDGDVFHADFSLYHGIDMLIGGSPCTNFSIAQKKENRETEPDSGIGWELFSQYARALREAKPRYFIYENNRSMADAIKEEISDTFGFGPIMIDSALVSGQRRLRYYWVGVLQDDGSYRQATIDQPEDRGILFKDVLDSGMTDRDTAHAVIASAGRTTYREYIVKNQGNVAFEPMRVGSLPRPDGSLSTSQAMRVYDVDGKSVGLKACGGGMGGRTGLYAVPAEEPSDNLTPGERVVYTVRDGRIAIKGKEYPIRLDDGEYRIRKLSVEECKRLQTVPEWYDMSCISNSQAYKCLGNGWTVDVIAWLMESVIRQE